MIREQGSCLGLPLASPPLPPLLYCLIITRVVIGRSINVKRRISTCFSIICQDDRRKFTLEQRHQATVLRFTQLQNPSFPVSCTNPSNCACRDFCVHKGDEKITLHKLAVELHGVHLIALNERASDHWTIYDVTCYLNLRTPIDTMGCREGQLKQKYGFARIGTEETVVACAYCWLCGGVGLTRLFLVGCIVSKKSAC